MAKKNSDVGASTNLSNFRTVITKLEGMGDNYDPGNDDISVVNLLAKHAEGVLIKTDYSAKEAAYRMAVGLKQKTFDNTGKLLSPIVRSLVSNRAEAVTIDWVKGYIDKYRGVSKIAKKEDDAVMDGDGTEGRSNRQTSYPFLIQHFENIYQTLLLEPKYAPKSNDAIKLPALAAVLGNMRTNMRLSDEAQDAFERVRSQQTKFHNDPETGICALVGFVKANLIEDFTVSSPEYRAVSYLSVKKLYDSSANKKKKKAPAETGGEEQAPEG